MARLADVPVLFRSIGVVAFAKRVWSEVNKDNLFTWASALAYSWLFAIFPFFLFLLALLPYLPAYTKAEAKQNIEASVDRAFPAETARLIRENIDRHLDEPKGLLVYVGLGIALWAASGGMAATMAALDRCYELETGRPFYQQRVLAVALTVGAALLLLAVVCLLPVGTLLKHRVLGEKHMSNWHPLVVLFDVVRWALSILGMLAVLTLIYYKGPAIRHQFHWLTPGAVFCVVVWVVLGLVFRFYVDRFGARSYNKTYGTVGGVAILLLFFYLDALVLLIGAEINSEIDFAVLKVRRGARDFRRAEAATAPPAPTSI